MQLYINGANFVNRKPVCVNVNVFDLDSPERIFRICNHEYR